MTKTEKIRAQIRDSFSEKLQAATKKTLGVEIETEYNIFEMRLVTRRKDGKKLTKMQRKFICGYEHGYSDAKELVT